MGEKDPTKDLQWVRIENTWLVTNRHVVLTKVKGVETLPDALTFNLRKLVSNRIEWEPITILKDELVNRTLFHKNNAIDVCIICIDDLISSKIKSVDQIMNWYGVSKDYFPGQNKINVEASSDAIVIGYPRGFYDENNLFPIVKSGIIATRWGYHFNGNPYFLIDAKLFPGSSGSIVLSKPTDIVVHDKTVFSSKEKQYAFLGIFSGEPFIQESPFEFDDITIIKKSGFNLGVVWYGHLIEEIIDNGIKYNTIP